MLYIVFFQLWKCRYLLMFLKHLLSFDLWKRGRRLLIFVSNLTLRVSFGNFSLSKEEGQSANNSLFLLNYITIFSRGHQYFSQITLTESSTQITIYVCSKPTIQQTMQPPHRYGLDLQINPQVTDTCVKTSLAQAVQLFPVSWCCLCSCLGFDYQILPCSYLQGFIDMLFSQQAFANLIDSKFEFLLRKNHAFAFSEIRINWVMCMGCYLVNRWGFSQIVRKHKVDLQLCNILNFSSQVFQKVRQVLNTTFRQWKSDRTGWSVAAIQARIPSFKRIFFVQKVSNSGSSAARISCDPKSYARRISANPTTPSALSQNPVTGTKNTIIFI
eukprot:TRINITY_DN1377_c0_g1_i1.p1 TRINITY_DN1377_c0_g1~~TRINITY_DN1377_c0_g1_i1.p1  ORF type:complete len:328 (-),score=-17.16 TRINITY_DN1377_c0_g1_i1:42-1025(-)